MKHIPLSCLALCLPLFAASAQAEDILSILARKSETPARLAPKTIPFSYTLTFDMTNIEGKDETSGQAIIRVNPNQAPGSRAQIISASDPEGDVLKEFLEDIEDPENTVEKQAENFWCGDSETPPEDESEFFADLSNIAVLSENETEAVLRPDMTKLAELLMQSDENADKNGKKVMKKLLKRIEGDITLAKPSAEMKGFSVKMTRPMTMMLVAKLKVMNLEQTCGLAPNGHYHMSTMKMNVEGKALGSKFGQDLDMAFLI